jgi:hypothetical protein
MLEIYLEMLRRGEVTSKSKVLDARFAPAGARSRWLAQGNERAKGFVSGGERLSGGTLRPIRGGMCRCVSVWSRASHRHTGICEVEVRLGVPGSYCRHTRISFGGGPPVLIPATPEAVLLLH